MATYDALPLEGYPSDLGLMLATLQETTRDWRSDMLQAGEPTEEELVWQVRPGGHSLGAIFLHIADVEISWIEEFALGRKMTEADLTRLMTNETRVNQGVWPTPPRQPYAWYLEQMDEARHRTLAACKDFPALGEEYLFQDQMTLTYRWTLAHVIGHEAYLAGQAMLLRDLFARPMLSAG